MDFARLFSKFYNSFYPPSFPLKPNLCNLLAPRARIRIPVCLSLPLQFLGRGQRSSYLPAYKVAKYSSAYKAAAIYPVILSYVLIKHLIKHFFGRFFVPFVHFVTFRGKKP